VFRKGPCSGGTEGVQERTMQGRDRGGLQRVWVQERTGEGGRGVYKESGFGFGNMQQREVVNKSGGQERAQATIGGWAAGCVLDRGGGGKAGGGVPVFIPL
jgi:hypothetical protein